MAVLGVVLGSIAISLETVSLSQRYAWGSVQKSEREGPRIPEAPYSSPPPPTPLPRMGPPSPKGSPPPPVPNLMMAADASLLADGAAARRRLPPPAISASSPPEYIPLSRVIASGGSGNGGLIRRRRARGKGGWIMTDEAPANGSATTSATGPEPVGLGATAEPSSAVTVTAVNVTAEHNITGEEAGVGWGVEGSANRTWGRGRGGRGRGGKGRGGRGGKGRGGKGRGSKGGGEGGEGGKGDRAADDPESADADVGEKRNPNLVLMLADDAAMSDIGAFSHQTEGTSHTPNLDMIAKRGVRFMNAHAASPICTPSRFAVLTGQRPSCSAKASSLRALSIVSDLTVTVPVPTLVSYESYPRPSRHRTLAHRLGEHGYVTGMVGLWHLGTPESVTAKKELKRVSETPAEKFAHAAGGKVKRAVAAEYAELQEHVKKVGGFESAERLYAAPLDTDGITLPAAMKVHNIEWVADGAAQFIQAHAAPSSPPFFLYVGWTLPHGPDAER